MTRTVKAGCMLCEAVCGLEVELEAGRVGRIRGDADDPFSRGHVCPKAVAIKDVMDDPDRLRTPVKKSADGHFVPVDWSDALSDAGRRIAEVQKRYGRNAVAIYLGNPTVHSHGALLAAPYLGRGLGTKSRFSATSVDQLPHMLAAYEMFGHQLLMPIPDVDRTDYFFMLGANPLASNGSIMTAPDIAGRLRALRERGGRLVVVDPRKTETAQLADEHIAVRPGGDAFLLLGILNVLFKEQRVHLGRLAEMVSGLEVLETTVRPFTPERVAPRAGVEPELIERLAREMSEAERPVAYGRVGACTQEFGGVTAWLTYALNLVLGRLDAVGGAMFTRPAADLVAFASLIGHKGSFRRWTSRVRGLPEFGGELPVSVLAEEILTPGDGQIRALVTVAGNPVLSTPNGEQLDRALAGLDVMVSVDIYRNETTRHADYILPTSFGFERDHYDLAFYALAVRNVARFTSGFVDPPSGVREDFDVLLDLAMSVRRHGGGKPNRSLDLTLRAMKAAGSRRIIDGLVRTGPHRGRWFGGLSVARLEKQPSGIDLGPLEPAFPDRIGHADRRVRAAPGVFVADIPRVEAEIERSSENGGALQLIGRRRLRSNNSWMHNSERLVKGADECVLLMHSQDAVARNLESGQRVRVASKVGAVDVELEVSDEMRPGVVSLPHGWGHHRPGTSLAVAERKAGVSLNDLTDDGRVDPVSGVAVLTGVPVEVSSR